MTAEIAYAAVTIGLGLLAAAALVAGLPKPEPRRVEVRSTQRRRR